MKIGSGKQDIKHQAKLASLRTPAMVERESLPLQSVTTTLWLIRHAEVEPRYQGVFGGQIDMNLSARGHEQALALAVYLHQKSFHALYASPMKRVQQTLAPWLANSAPRPVIVPELKEVDFGDWTGLNWDQVQSRFGVHVSAWLDQLECAGIPNAESGPALRARVEPCLKRILESHPGQQVVIACHGGVIRILLSILLDWPLPRWGSVEIDYASVTRVRYRPSEIRLQLLNYTPWRDGEAGAGDSRIPNRASLLEPKIPLRRKGSSRLSGAKTGK